MDDNGVPVIEVSANYIYLIILGDKKNVVKLVEDLNGLNPDKKDTIYYATKIDTPLAQECYSNVVPSLGGVNMSMSVAMADGAEVAQCYTLAHGRQYHSDLYMVTVLEQEMSFGFPKFDLANESYPEKMVVGWFNKNVSYVPKGVRKSMEPITVVGTNNDILIVACRMSSV